jgi:hypothetical protein
MTTEWVPAACTLPTVDRPVRVAEFDELFASARVERLAADRLRLHLTPAPEMAGMAASLAAREIGCCSFFTFDLAVRTGALTLEIGVPAGQVEVLDALGTRAEAMRA